MSYFTEDFLLFFKELDANNNKEWFDANRKRYESVVKKPFCSFLNEMIGRINAEDSNVRIEAKDAVMRINRDIRFSSDKTPYNTHYGGIISATGRKDKTVPGLFLRFSTEGVGIFGGAHGVDKTQLAHIRNAIAQDLNGFRKAIMAKDFVEKFGEIKGEKNKRLPPEFQEVAKNEPLIANKAFYYSTVIDKKFILDDKLPEIIMDYWHIGRPVQKFLENALKS